MMSDMENSVINLGSLLHTRVKWEVHPAEECAGRFRVSFGDRLGTVEVAVCNSEELAEGIAYAHNRPRATPEQIEAARDQYQTDDINIDDNALMSDSTEKHYWVQAWVFVEEKTDA